MSDRGNVDTYRAPGRTPCGHNWPFGFDPDCQTCMAERERMNDTVHSAKATDAEARPQPYCWLTRGHSGHHRFSWDGLFRHEETCGVRDLPQSYHWGSVQPEDMTKLQMIADMLFNRSEDRSKFAKQIADSIAEPIARRLASALMFVRGVKDA